MLSVDYDRQDYPAALSEEQLSENLSFRILAHWHEEFEFLRILEGGMCEEINGESVDLNEGDVLFVNSKQMHRSKVRSIDGGDKYCSYQIIQLHPSALYGDVVTARKYIIPLMNNSRFSFLHIKKDNPQIGKWNNIFDMCFEILRSGESFCELGFTGAFYMILSLLKNEYDYEYEGIISKSENVNLTDVKNMAAFVYTNYRNKITIDDIAGAVNTGRSRCTRLFRKYMEKTPTEFVNDYRLMVAAQLLRETDRSIADIACGCGFYDQSYFGKMFLGKFGESPKKYRLKTSNL